MLNISILLILSYVDLKKRELSIRLMFISSMLWIFSIYEISIEKGIIASSLIFLSILTREKIGLADTILLSLICFEDIVNFFNVIIISNIILVIVIIFFNSKIKSNKEIPFIPFITAAYILVYFGGI